LHLSVRHRFPPRSIARIVRQPFAREA